LAPLYVFPLVDVPWLEPFVVESLVRLIAYPEPIILF
jgi:hypothetical protein